MSGFCMIKVNGSFAISISEHGIMLCAKFHKPSSKPQHLFSFSSHAPFLFIAHFFSALTPINPCTLSNPSYSSFFSSYVVVALWLELVWECELTYKSATFHTAKIMSVHHRTRVQNGMQYLFMHLDLILILLPVPLGKSPPYTFVSKMFLYPSVKSLPLFSLLNSSILLPSKCNQCTLLFLPKCFKYLNFNSSSFLVLKPSLEFLAWVLPSLIKYMSSKNTYWDKQNKWNYLRKAQTFSFSLTVTRQSEIKDDHLGTITRVNSLKYGLITGGKEKKKKALWEQLVPYWSKTYCSVSLAYPLIC